MKDNHKAGFREYHEYSDAHPTPVPPPSGNDVDVFYFDNWKQVALVLIGGVCTAGWIAGMTWLVFALGDTLLGVGP